MVTSLTHLNYEERLQILNLSTLHYRQRRGDMLAIYNMLHGRYDMDFLDFFTFSHNIHQTRGHSFKLHKYYSRTDIWKNFFTRRVINPWNNLPNEVIGASSTNDFKNLIDHYTLNNMYTSD